ncbi:DUF4276 family protein [Plebeiibacterium sediminum]|uniref:DUF4276 family protein n=1 Tax=Plebeiibacterium sediminum TaxID=2992112 RepID=A0AAE3M4Y9_9BACT|nr:DUF4276 family protein [Plebeiobacterium sediminum]MCW3787229.1 DUF4276 family protein [Plebeiobacterium sediminum]
MKRLVFIVEGDTEIILVEKIIMPYLVAQGITNPVNCQTITTNRKQNKKGGVSTYGKFKNEVNRTLRQGNVLVTTLIDFFKLPADFPEFTHDSHNIGDIETAILKDFGDNENFIPYIQRHELEALMFSSRDGFDLVIDDEKKIALIDAINKEYPNPEDINNSPQTAPSKRLGKIFNYDKTGDGEMILEMVGIEPMLEKCPRFAEWIGKIVNRLKG